MKILLLFLSGFLFAGVAQAKTAYYVDSVSGNDDFDGRSPQGPWKTLRKASDIEYGTGDKLFLKRGCVFNGTLKLKATGTEDNPVLVDVYGPAASQAVIDAKGYTAGIHVQEGDFLEINNIEITADAGKVMEPQAAKNRFGVWIFNDGKKNYHNIKLNNLNIHDIFASRQVKDEGQNPTSNMGMGIAIFTKKNSTATNIVISNCRIEKTGHTGITFKARSADSKVPFPIQNVRIVDNTLKNIGGPGIVPCRTKDLLVRGNTVDRSGSSIDPRMHARGSGIWPWRSSDVLIEKNRFMHARGKADSCGAHIDFGCRNVIVQYNLSLDNEGGFVEFLGDNYNCAYRYNISINDGARVKKKNGAKSDGKILWLSGFNGKKKEFLGPFHSYIYNNTIYTKKNIRAGFCLTKSTSNALVANNIFYLLGKTENVYKDNDLDQTQAAAVNVLFANNLFQRASLLPGDLPIQNKEAIVADPGFKNPGGLKPEDYIPDNSRAIKDKGIRIKKLSGDQVGLSGGLAVGKDFFGNKIKGLPDLGAVEMGD